MERKLSVILIVHGEEIVGRGENFLLFLLFIRETSDIRTSREVRSILIVQGRRRSENTPVNRSFESK